MAAGRKTVLVIDSQDEARERLSQTLRRDYRVIRAASAESGLALMDKEDVDVLVADVQQPGLGGIDLLQIVRENFPLVEIIMTSAAPDVDGAVRRSSSAPTTSSRRTPIPTSCASSSATPASGRTCIATCSRCRTRRGDAGGREFITGPSTGLKDVLETVHKVAKLSATVLILGESGTGKELLARLLHRESANPDARVHRGQRRRDSARARREHAVRPREGFVHRRAAAAHRQVRARQRRHAVPRRDRRSQIRPAGQAAARDPGRRGRARRRLAADPHAVPADRRDQHRSRARGEGRQLPRGSLLPPQRHPGAAAAAARAHRRPAGRSPTSSSSATARASTRTCAASPNRRWRCCRTTGGRATSASSKT